MFRKILIANRGEVAVRIMKTAKKLGIKTVAIYSKADEKMGYLKEADEKVLVGPFQSKLSYLNMEAILQAALQTECQAIHPGYGFLAENALFAELCKQYKIAFIGPSAKLIRSMGDKANAREMMKNAGLEIIPGSKGNISDLKILKETAEEIGFPILLKATAGGGGKGMRICQNSNELEENFAQASQEAEKAFGNSAIYMERFIPHGRHIEFQILADHFGNVIHLGERECSVQRRHQKLIEEAPSPAVSKNLRCQLGEKIVRAVQSIGYTNAGTIEFLMDEENHLYFMEMNTRLQVEHPVTEMITGIDIVEQQIKIAAEQKLELKMKDVKFEKAALECRINAEDPEKNFQPCPGKITEVQFPKNVDSSKLRIDTFVEKGSEISPFYDSMICKILSCGKDRKEAIDIMEKALNEFVIEGVSTTISSATKILQNDKFQSGNYNTKIVEEILSEG